MTDRSVPGFLPSRHGLRFANAFPPGPTLRLGPLDPRNLGIGDASQGLCGGMALTARDLWAAGIEAPADATGPPPNGSPRYRALVRRQVQSLDWLRVPLRYLDLQAFRPDPPSGLASTVLARLGRRPARIEAMEREWPRIHAEIDAGRPCVVGLIRASGASPWLLSRNHQVLAFGYRASADGVVIRVYDPNHPGRDDVELHATKAAGEVGLRQSTGEPLLGWFRQPYPPPRSVAAWR